MTNNITHEQAIEVIEKGVEALIEKENRAYTCGFLKGAMKSLAISMPEAREEIINLFAEYINQK
jgi:hypothetical protein